jgi:hypothetical protein
MGRSVARSFPYAQSSVHSGTGSRLTHTHAYKASYFSQCTRRLGLGHLQLPLLRLLPPPDLFRVCLCVCVCWAFRIVISGQMGFERLRLRPHSAGRGGGLLAGRPVSSQSIDQSIRQHTVNH